MVGAIIDQWKMEAEMDTKIPCLLVLPHMLDTILQCADDDGTGGTEDTHQRVWKAFSTEGMKSTLLKIASPQIHRQRMHKRCLSNLRIQTLPRSSFIQSCLQVRKHHKVIILYRVILTLS